MKNICLFVALGFFAVNTVYADDTTGVEPASSPLHIKHRKGVDPAEIEKHIQYDVTVNTRYGVVQYNKHGSMIAVNRELVYNNSDVALIENIGDFKLSNEEVLLFEGHFLGSPMAGIFGATFFLILKPSQPPTIVQAVINPLENPVEKAWQEGDVIYVDYREENTDLAGPPLKLISDKVIFSNGTPFPYKNKK